MIAEIGHAALILGAALAALQGLSLILFRDAHAKHHADLQPKHLRILQRLAASMAALVTVAMACLMTAFACSDFSVWVVALHSHSALPLMYKIAAAWGHHEGSMLLWLWVLVMMGWCASRQPAPAALLGRALGVQGLVALGFFAFILLASNPFMRLFPLPLDGQDLNPLLQDISLILHPPFLYFGYVGFSIVFAFAVAALMCPRGALEWWRWLRPWALWSWMFLTIGITLGSFWAYYELGWGGWWFWDPVENASLMPWLAGTGLLHSLRVVERTGSLQRWTIFQALLAFALSLMGTFLVRSGALSSVHAFAVDPGRGLFILGLLTLYVGGGFLVFAIKAPRFADTPLIPWPSRAWLLSLNTLVVFVILLTVALGTLYPLVSEACGAGFVSIGAPYFNATLQPIAGVLFLLLGFGMCWPWAMSQPSSQFWHRVGTAGLLTLSALIAIVVLMPPPTHRPWIAYGGVALALWMVAATLVTSLREITKPGRGPRAGIGRHIGRLGFHIAHTGLALSVLGMAVDTGWSDQSIVALAPGQTTRFRDMAVTFERVDKGVCENYSYTRAHILITQWGQLAAPICTLTPEKRRYIAKKTSITEAAIYSGLTYHLYCNLGESYTQGLWTLRLYYHPLVGWIWWGGLMMALGGLVALLGQSRGKNPHLEGEPSRRKGQKDHEPENHP